MSSPKSLTCGPLLVALAALAAIAPPAVSQQGHLVREHEPNNSFALALPVSVNDTLVGAIDSACDVDVFRLDIRAGTRLTIDRNSMDPLLQVWLLDSAGARRDSLGSPFGGLTENQSHGDFVFLRDGRYYLHTATTFHENPDRENCAWRPPDWSYVIRLSARSIIEEAANALIGGAPLSAAAVAFLDEHGNHNGSFDAGDLRAYLRSLGRLP